MSMRDRLRRRKHARSHQPPGAPPLAPPPSAGPDEETVRIARKDFRRRRNAGRWRRLRLVLLSLLLLAAVSASVWLVFFSSYVAARNVEITGTSTLADARVERAADVPTGTPLARVDLGAVRARVEANASVKSAEVSRSWPHAVHIAVTERIPVAVIEGGAGLQALDADGVVFGHYEARPKRLPLVRTESDLADEALVECGRVIASLPPRISSRVETVEVSSVDKIQLVLGNGRRVLWGSAEDSTQKAEVLAVLLRRPGQEIDVSVPGRPTTR
jgi:cell division protein FtsQ